VADLGEAGTGAVQVQWRVSLIEQHNSRYIPVELASAGFDPTHGRIYLGASDGRLRAFDATGRVLYRYNVGSPIESAPAVDEVRDQVVIAGADGRVHALRGANAEVLFEGRAPGIVRTRPLLTDDAIYVATEDDAVVALSREDGAVLWTYRREAAGEFHIAGHAGLAIAGRRVLAGFSDGTVAALDLTDGSVLWERATDVDIETTAGGAPVFTDVDTTPIIAGDTVFVASFHAGLYALALSNGSVLWREPDLTTITSMVAVGDGASDGEAGAGAGRLLVSSADRGLEVMDPSTREVAWSRASERGSPTPPVVTPQGMVLVGDSQGSLLALALQSGQELGRLDGGNGFSAPAGVSHDLAMVLTNGGDALCLRLR
jgi:outer membrane protein assembly factor BamB